MKVTVDVPLTRVADLLCSAFEGGSNYWYEITKMQAPLKLEFRSSPELNSGKPFPHIDYPLNEGGYLTIKSLEEPEKHAKRLNLAAVQRGLKLMAEKQPAHWANFLAENDDAITADVFLQLCLFEEVIYG